MSQVPLQNIVERQIEKQRGRESERKREIERKTKRA